ncbi:hypothetical protein H6F67_19580 [Microcoleus sp. FACHB-1515]|uniref:hypothetical protein n=1 Tax=Cyanophyceae TaxID=3028117 RepID=UPI0016824352|nr:hypothetical protein [Microcoleus sp. FACHB-1515]MBD2092053.1 hypothetical protein [Microcoleus sp. FACHB-1515]
MLHHISVAVNYPAQVATVLAEAIGGQAFPFPPHPGSYFVMAGDEFGTAIELYPATTQLVPGSDDVVFAEAANSPHYLSVHAAISVPTTQAQIEAIGQREGWLVRVCDRGPFKVIEFWVENKLMLEFLPPEFAATYMGFVKIENWKVFLAMAESGEFADKHQSHQVPASV